ncbi:RDD family protein [Kitasatospora camelliae]|uniref:RDD family protein n=1 Tax=Kitasatospora camelliae TaxID=3156397 RepID=A0AAU8JU75_9ACTN
MSDLVTGEAVVLGLREAKLPSRALARALDAVVQLIGFLVTVLLVEVATPDLDSAASDAVALGVLVFYLVVLPVLVETLSKGRSLGKLAFGLRVVRTDGGPARFRHALVRGLVAVVEFGMGAAPAIITSLVSPRGRRLGDVFAGTVVIRERLPRAARQHGELPPVPPELLHALGGDLAALDFSAVPDGLWLASRQFLGRLDQLDPAVAFGMAQRMVADLAAHTGRPAPYGLAPTAYLAAVLAERQRREWARAAAAGAGWGQFQPPVAASPYAAPAFPAQPYPVAPQPGPQMYAQPAQQLAQPPQVPPQPTPAQDPAPPVSPGGFAPPA